MSMSMAEKLQIDLDERIRQFEMLKGKYEKLLNWSEIFDSAEIPVKN